MNYTNRWKMYTQKAVITAALGGVVLAGSAVADIGNNPTASAASASISTQQKQMVIENLNSFYKPALKGQFPGNASDFMIGKTTRSEVIKRFGPAEVPRKSSSGYDAYTATMGSPGYAFHYNKNNVLDEMRYFGTNVERQTNIGGITIPLLHQQWYAPASTTKIGSGTKQQTKVTYLRGDYKLEFIFNTSTDLDHINLLKA